MVTSIALVNQSITIIVSVMENMSAGDLTEREDIKRRLKCKSFSWYLENVYPESNMRNEFTYLGEVRSNRKFAPLIRWRQKFCKNSIC